MIRAKKNQQPAKIFTVGVAKKGAENFFELLELHQITNVIDVRLYGNTQFAGFAKAPDLKFFLSRISRIEYKNDLKLAPEENSLKLYQQKIISWEEYAAEFERQFKERRGVQHILQNYSDSPEIRQCLLCTEVSPQNCQRRLVAEKFAQIFDGMEIVHL